MCESYEQFLTFNNDHLLLFKNPYCLYCIGQNTIQCPYIDILYIDTVRNHNSRTPVKSVYMKLPIGFQQQSINELCVNYKLITNYHQMTYVCQMVAITFQDFQYSIQSSKVLGQTDEKFP